MKRGILVLLWAEDQDFGFLYPAMNGREIKKFKTS